jgi:large subunit ribosomal protein L15
MPIHRRLPKVGFTSRKKLAGTNVYSLVSLASLSASGLEGEVKLEDLASKGLVNRSGRKVKLLGGSEIDRALKIEVHAASASAKAAVEKAGGEVRIIGK